MTQQTSIYCCGCNQEIKARLTNGSEIYPHRSNLFKLPFWKCDKCNNFIGCHHKTIDEFRPLGNIATPELRNLRKKIHSILDPLWNHNGRRWTKQKKRKMIYAFLSEKIGYDYHTGNISSVEEAEKVLFFINDFKILQK